MTCNIFWQHNVLTATVIATPQNALSFKNSYCQAKMNYFNDPIPTHADSIETSEQRHQPIESML